MFDLEHLYSDRLIWNRFEVQMEVLEAKLDGGTMV